MGTGGADFDTAVAVVFEHEGGLVDDPADPGGITKYGISLRFWQRLCPNKTADDVRALTLRDAKSIYRAIFWEREGYGEIRDQSIATKTLDLAVNMGPAWAAKCLQRALRAVGVAHVKDDGILGPITLRVANAADPTTLLPALRSEAAGYYRNLRRARFLKGWLKRAYS